MLNPIERRKYPRIDEAVPLRYKELRRGASLAKGTLTKNLSAGGVRFNTDRFISLACRLIVEMKLPACLKPIKTVSKIAWIKKLPTGENYEVGNRFLNMTKQDKATISEYTKKAGNPSSPPS